MKNRSQAWTGHQRVCCLLWSDLGCIHVSSRTPSRSFPCFSTAPSRFLSSFPRKLRGNQLLVWAQISQIGKIPGYFADFLGFASDFAPDQLSDSGKLESCQKWSTKHPLFPWKFPETKSAGEPLVSFFVPRLKERQLRALTVGRQKTRLRGSLHTNQSSLPNAAKGYPPREPRARRPAGKKKTRAQRAHLTAARPAVQRHGACLDKGIPPRLRRKKHHVADTCSIGSDWANL